MQVYDILTVLMMCVCYIWYTIKAKEKDMYKNTVVVLLAIIVVLLVRIANG